MQEQNLQLSELSAFSQFQHNNSASNKAFATELWNIQLFYHNRDNITLELAKDQLENKKQKKNKKNTLASQQLGHPQLRQQQLQLSQLCRKQPDTATSRQLPKELLSATSSQTAAWPAASLTNSFSFSKQELPEQQLHNKSLYNQLVNQELVHNKLQRTDALGIWVVEQQLAPTKALQHSKASFTLSSCRRTLQTLSNSLMSTRVLPILALSFDTLNFSNFSSSLGSGNLNQLSAETKEQKKPTYKKLCQTIFENIFENRQLPEQVAEEQLLQLQLLSIKVLEKNFGQQLAENELQQNLSQDQQQLQDSNLAQKISQQLSLDQLSVTEKNFHNELSTNFWNKAFQKNFLASKELAEKNFYKKQLVRSSFAQIARGACKQAASTSLLTRSK